MSRVVVPYVRGKLQLRTAVRVVEQAPEAEFVCLDSDNAWAYPTLITSLWRGQEDLVIVEEDVVPPPGAIAAMLACQEPWCGHLQWEGRGYIPRTLGLVKFSARLQARYLRLANRAYVPDDPRQQSRSWRSADTSLAYELEKMGQVWHCHQPPVIHLHDYSPQGGGPDPQAPGPRAIRFEV